MSVDVQQEGTRAKVLVSGEFTIYTVGDIKARLAEVMQNCDDIEVDLADITEVDTAGVQLMLIAKRNPGKNVVFTNHTPALLRLIDLASLGRTLGDLMVVDAAH